VAGARHHHGKVQAGGAGVADGRIELSDGSGGRRGGEVTRVTGISWRRRDEMRWVDGKKKGLIGCGVCHGPA
jgi:hypothetical protein